MDRRSRWGSVGIVLMVVLLLVGTSGCGELLLASNAASFGAGWLLGRLGVATTTDIQCFRNGVQIDCSEIPPQ